MAALAEEPRTTVSIGVASLFGDVLDAAVLVAAADTALCASTEAGRYRVTCSSGDPLVPASL